MLKPSIVTMDTNVEIQSYQYQPRVAYVLRHSVADPEQETNYPRVKKTDAIDVSFRGNTSNQMGVFGDVSHKIDI